MPQMTSLRADAPSFAPLGITPSNTIISTGISYEGEEGGGAPSSSSSSNKQQQQQRNKHRRSNKQQQQQQRNHQPHHHNHNHHPKSYPKGIIEAAVSTAAAATTTENHHPKSPTKISNGQRRRGRRRAEQTQQEPGKQQPPAVNNDDFRQGVEGSQQQKQQQQPSRRRRNPRNKNSKQQQQHFYNPIQNNHHHDDVSTNNEYTIDKEMNDENTEELQQQKNTEEQQQQQQTNLLFMVQDKEEAFPILLNASSALDHPSLAHHGDKNNLETSLSSSSCGAGGVWKNAHEALEWTTSREEGNATTVDALLTNHSHSKLSENHHHHILGMTRGSSPSSSELLTILPQQRRPSPTRLLLLQKRSNGNPETLESIVNDGAAPDTCKMANGRGDDSSEKQKEEEAEKHCEHHKRQQQQQQQQPLKTWDMEKLRNRWWQLLRDRPAPVRATPALFANNAHNDGSDDSSTTTEESFEDVYFGKGAHQPHQQQHQQDKHEIDESYYSSSLPLHEAIRRNDEACLRALLKSDAFPNNNSNHDIDDESSCSSGLLSPLQLAVQLDRPRLVRILFAHSTYNDKSTCNIDLSSSSSRNYQKNNGGCNNKPAILMAAELGHEECLQAFLSASHGPSILLTRDLDGNTVLHYCCKTENATVSMLRLCLRAATGCSYNHNSGSTSSSSSSSSLLAKLLLHKNNQGQTCMHVACEQGRVDLVEVILSDTNGSLTLLSKVLSMHDAQQQTPLLAAVASGCTDVVMALLMWRGNNVISSTNKAGGGMPVPSLLSSSPCPLARAVQSRNVDMVLLLLEFNDPSAGKRGYNLTRALHEAVRMVKSTSQTAVTTTSSLSQERAFAKRDNDSTAHHNNDQNDSDSEDVLLDIVRILVNAGANPCCSTSLVDSADSNHIAYTSSSAVCIAAELGAPEMLSVLLTSYQAHLDEIRNARRRDPILQKQPESFFAALESRENAERTSCLRDALAITLFYGWKKQTSTPIDSRNGGDVFFECSLALYRAGAILGKPGLERLKQTFAASGRNAKSVKPMANVTVPSSMGPTLYEVKYSHLLGSGDCQSNNNKKPRSLDDKPVRIDDNTAGHQFWSRVMQKSTWKVSGQDCVCDWIPLVEESAERDVIHYPRGDVRLVCNDGQEFVVHSTIVTKKSAKLAAAIHFECMKSSMAHDDDDDNHLLDDDNIPEIEMSACSGRLCRWLLQHIYHGSIANGLPDNDSVECCHALLELMLVAGEYLCWSLVQECEMRLLAADSCSCHCCLCSRTTATATCCSKKDEIECEYYSVGPSMCITPDTVLDVLAVSQYMGQSLDETSYTLRKSDQSTLPSWLVGFATTKWIVAKPLEALKEAAIGTILMHFRAVMETDAFLSQFAALNDAHDNQAAAVDQQSTERQRGGLILLQNTMDELVELVTVASVK